jgi:O-methyltransferase
MFIEAVLRETQKSLQPDVHATANPGATSGLSTEEYAAIYEQVRPYTMVPEAGIAFVVQETIRLIESDVPGVLVECGVWRGGASMAMLAAQRFRFGRVVRTMVMLDSFEGLPPVESHDGPLARAWQEGACPEFFFDNCRASVDELRDALSLLDFSPADYRIIKGWFCNTVPELREELGEESIALLRLDSDWYASTKVCLENLFPLVAVGGTVAIDDYYAWDGCAKAVHEYLGSRGLSYRIRSLPDYSGAFLRKRDRLSFND